MYPFTKYMMSKNMCQANYNTVVLLWMERIGTLKLSLATRIILFSLPACIFRFGNHMKVLRF